MLVLLIISWSRFRTPSVINLPSVGKAAKTPRPVIQGADRQKRAITDREGNTTTAATCATGQPRHRCAANRVAAKDVPVVIAADKSVKYETVVVAWTRCNALALRQVGLSVQTTRRAMPRLRAAHRHEPGNHRPPSTPCQRPPPALMPRRQSRWLGSLLMVLACPPCWWRPPDLGHRLAKQNHDGGWPKQNCGHACRCGCAAPSGGRRPRFKLSAREKKPRAAPRPNPAPQPVRPTEKAPPVEEPAKHKPTLHCNNSASGSKAKPTAREKRQPASGRT